VGDKRGTRMSKLLRKKFKGVTIAKNISKRTMWGNNMTERGKGGWGGGFVHMFKGGVPKKKVGVNPCFKKLTKCGGEGKRGFGLVWEKVLNRKKLKEGETVVNKGRSDDRG